MPTTIPTPVRTARLAAKMRAIDLAQRAGVSLGTISLAERHGILSRPMAEKLAEALGVKPEALRVTGRKAGR
jgi:transcriptional regulator with XRE-family HTH domain